MPLKKKQLEMLNDRKYWNLHSNIQKKNYNLTLRLSMPFAYLKSCSMEWKTIESRSS